MSFSDTKKGFTQLWDKLEECKRQRRAVQDVSKLNRKDLVESRQDLRKAKGQLITLTKKEHAKSKEKSAASYATAAATALIISYQVVEVAGGFGRWAPVFEHEATIGVLQVMIGSILAFAMRPLQH